MREIEILRRVPLKLGHRRDVLRSSLLYDLHSLHFTSLGPAMVFSVSPLPLALFLLLFYKKIKINNNSNDSLNKSE